ncbi:hypothetical protein HAX54_052056 [Datura stramonium]|uniref:Dirigent protein n=1 Tax=Datura stramonium TaxID=4076 RepID=A0ABS8WN92_DATST|nr:hypothetical protein [Datura stramonium]
MVGKVEKLLSIDFIFFMIITLHLKVTAHESTLGLCPSQSSCLETLKLQVKRRQDSLIPWPKAVVRLGLNGVAPRPAISQTTTPFGTLYVFQDPLTLKANSNSKIVGTAEGTSITSSLDGLQSVSIAKITLKMKHHKGSISVMGGTHNTKPSNQPVVGGTGDFLFVQGYVTSSPVDLARVTVIFKIQFHLYWPPYAIPSNSK